MAKAFETITVQLVAIGITEATRDDSNHALITSETDNFRYRVDGNDPTATVGHLVLAGGVVTLEGRGELQNFKAIRDTGATSDVVLSCSYDKRSFYSR